MAKTGVSVYYPAFLFEGGSWYISKEVQRSFAATLKPYLLHHSVTDIVRSCEQFRRRSVRRIDHLVGSNVDVPTALRELEEILGVATAYIWLTHGLEPIYDERLRRALKPYARGDLDRFIGDVVIPRRQNAHARLVSALRGRVPLTTIVERYGWLKIRDGFGPMFTLNELRRERQRIRREPITHPHRPQTPKKLEPLLREARSLVYLRTYRTEVFYELLAQARPLLRRVARAFGMPYGQLKHYRMDDLLAGRPRRITETSSACIDGQLVFFRTPLLAERSAPDRAIRGTIAFAGTVRGRVAIVRKASELGKVRKGDILVAPMTFPAFIMAMQRAAAFVTDEGGLTCHAAIVAREMRKPCIVGTKHATRVLLDGDRVEVDATTGHVRKL